MAERLSNWVQGSNLDLEKVVSPPKGDALLAQLPNELLQQVMAGAEFTDLANLRLADKQTRSLLGEGLHVQNNRHRQKLSQLHQRIADANPHSASNAHYARMLSRPALADPLAQAVFLKRMEAELKSEERIEQTWAAASELLVVRANLEANTDDRYRSLVPETPGEFSSETAKAIQVMLWELPENSPHAFSRPMMDKLEGIIKKSLPDASSYECCRLLTRLALSLGANEDRQSGFFMSLKAYAPALWSAFHAGNFEAVEAFVKEGMNIDRAYPYLGPPSLLAAMVDRGASTLQVKRMVEWGADPNGKVDVSTGLASWWGRETYLRIPPVCSAARQGNVELVETLLKLGADPFDSEAGGWSLMAEINGHAEPWMRALMLLAYESNKKVAGASSGALARMRGTSML